MSERIENFHKPTQRKSSLVRAMAHSEIVLIYILPLLTIDSSVPTVMIPINVTHQAILTKEWHRKLLDNNSSVGPSEALPPARTPLRHTLSTLLSFFASSYQSTFGFNDGPPLHDALTVAYASKPELFQGKRYRVDVELSGQHCVGETVVDVWDYRGCDDTWGPQGKNVLVTQDLDVSLLNVNISLILTQTLHWQVNGFFDMFLDCVAKCDLVSPLNKAT